MRCCFQSLFNVKHHPIKAFSNSSQVPMTNFGGVTLQGKWNVKQCGSYTPQTFLFWEEYNTESYVPVIMITCCPANNIFILSILFHTDIFMSPIPCCSNSSF